MDDLRKRFKALVTDKLSVDPHDFEDAFSKPWHFLGADSLDSVEIILELEKEFDISISDEDSLQLTTPEKSYNYLSDKIKAG